MDSKISDLVIEQAPDKGNHLGAVHNFKLLKEASHIVTLKRKAGNSNEGHFHKGDLNSKNPEELLIIEGTIEMVFEDLNKEISKVQIQAGSLVKIPAFIFHSYKVIKDCILMEFKQDAYNPENTDTFFREEFESLQNN